MRKMIFALMITCVFVNHDIYSQSISVEDTRIINSPPTSYGQNIKFEFKDRSVIGVPGTGSYSGMFTFAPWFDNTGNKHHQLNFNDGGIFYRNGWPSSNSWGQWRTVLIENENGNVGIGTNTPLEKLTIAGGHGDTKLRLFSTGNGSDQPSNLSLWASEPGVTYYGTGIGYNVNGSPYYGRIDNSRGSSYVRFLPGETKFEFQNGSGNYINNVLVIKESGNIGIGTTYPEAKLTVKGKIVASEIQVKDVGNIPDYVFKPDYELMSLSKVEDFVKLNQHLPEVPSEKEFKENGMNMAEMNVLLLKKIEELTLYAIEQNKVIEEIKQTLKNQNKKIKK